MLELKAEKRTVFGKKLKADRALGKLPIVVHGPKEKPGSYFVPLETFRKIFSQAGETSIISLKTGAEDHDVLIHEVAIHPLTNQPIHADLYVIEKGKKLEIDVPLVFVGVSPAVKELAGTLVKVLHELKIEALPKDLPRELTVDISALATLDSQILISDLALPAGVKVLHKSDEVVASIGTVKEEVEEPTTTPDLSAIEVEKKGKKEEETEAPVV